jgi:hypothetical protein
MSRALNITGVMPALVAGIHALVCRPCRKDVDGRDKPGHDGVVER